MSREVRMVPADWKHPTQVCRHHTRCNPCYVPLLEHAQRYTADEIAEGVRDGWLDATKPNYGLDEGVMPQWPASERTHLQMYETCSEGTPISPVMETPEQLARWLANNGASAFGRMTATYEQWLATARAGWAPSMIITNGAPMSGVEFVARTPERAP